MSCEQHTHTHIHTLIQLFTKVSRHNDTSQVTFLELLISEPLPW